MTRRYPEYRDSGVEWLGEVPSHWDVGPLKRRYSVTLGKMLQPDAKTQQDVFAQYLRAANIQWGYVDVSDMNSMWFLPADTRNLTLVSGDLLVSEGGDVGRSALWRNELTDCYFQNSVNRVRPKENADTTYLYYWICAIKANGYIDVLCNKSTIAHFTAEKVAAVPVPLPPLPEQTAIAAFLDVQTAAIDGLIEQQRRLIALLREKRQAVISHAVTRGLNPKAPLKPSGIVWLGDVPEGWEVVPTGYRYEVQLGRMLNEERSTGPNMRPYLRVFDVQWREINVIDLPMMDFPPDAQERYRLLPGDLIVNEGGSYVGRSAIWRGELDECYYQKALHRLRPRNAQTDTAEFFYFVMEMATMRSIFIAGGNQTTIDHLTAEQLRAYRFAFPTREEQVRIAEYLNTVTVKLDSLTTTAESAIALLVERRAALISAAVTGKIDVRTLAKVAAA
jgi:type I restriction enzyme S subunit